jgi:hypothetical protein
MRPRFSSKRDPRRDVLRGMVLLMIFVDHIPGNVLSMRTLPFRLSMSACGSILA